MFKAKTMCSKYIKTSFGANGFLLVIFVFISYSILCTNFNLYLLLKRKKKTESKYKLPHNTSKNRAAQRIPQQF